MCVPCIVIYQVPGILLIWYTTETAAVVKYSANINSSRNGLGGTRLEKLSHSVSFFFNLCVGISYYKCGRRGAAEEEEKQYLSCDVSASKREETINHVSDETFVLPMFFLIWLK